MKKTLLLSALLAYAVLRAQVSNIAGVINQYTAVTAIDPVTNAVTVADPSLFALGDRALLIQMQGATMNTTNSANFGNLTNRDGAGSYEFIVICNVNAGASEITFEKALVNTYKSGAVAGAGIQLVTVPQYADALVTGTLSAQPWNGSTGGLLVFEASGTVQLGANIDVSGQGFRGGVFENKNPFCGLPYAAYSYPASPGRGGKKGEGIAPYVLNDEYGRGKQVNGGGGGNDHNSGGAGGGNYSAGGNGGERSGGSCPGIYEGIGGLALSGTGYSAGNPYLFMGGGGGAGHGNNNEGRSGGNGGGIVIIRAGVLDGAGFAIRANGVAAQNSDSDGGSGGGAGGTIALAVNSFTANALTLQAAGGKGGNTAINCEGPGGGGAGGVIWTTAALPGTVTRQLAGGIAGSANACGGAAQGAAAGTTGVELTALALSEGTGLSPCVLPVVLGYFRATADGDQVQLAWETYSAYNFAYYAIERSTDGQHFDEQGRLHAPTTQTGPQTHTWTDPLPLRGVSYYRLRMVDLDGSYRHSAVEQVQFDLGQAVRWFLLDQPQQCGLPIALIVDLPTPGPLHIALSDLRGARIGSWSYTPGPGRHTLALPVQTLAPGLYHLSLTAAGQCSVQLLRVW